MCKKLVCITSAVMIVLSMCACHGKRSRAEIVPAEIFNTKSHAVQKYVETTYGIADNPIYGERITHKQTDYGQTTIDYEEKIKENSNGGAVFFKKITSEKQKHGLLCVDISDEVYGEEKQKIRLKTEYRYDYSDLSAGSYAIELPEAKEQTRYYVVESNRYLAIVELAEETDDSNGDPVYSEEIDVYKLEENTIDDLYSIRRNVRSGTHQLADFSINSDSEWMIYASGYDKYTAEGANLVSTQQEFCDRANELLTDCSLDCIEVNKLSWENRWFDLNIDESSLDEDMVKIDFSYSEPVKTAEDKETADIVIEINVDNEQQMADASSAEIDDTPVVYDHGETQNSIIAPDNMPQSIDVNTLQDLRSFDIDGFWYSTDYRYVYNIYTKQPRTFITLDFADLKGAATVNRGQVKQTSLYSVILRAMEDDGFSPEVFASNGQLVSDTLTLIKADDSLAFALQRSWADSYRTYTFDDTGKYEVTTERDSYSGQYFIMDDHQIALEDDTDKVRIYDYSISGDSLVLGNLTLTRQ